MSKLIVNSPSGRQELIEVGEGGGYFDPDRVVWDERTDGPPPEITLGGIVLTSGGPVFDSDRMAQHQAAILAAQQAVPVSLDPRQIRHALTRLGLRQAVEDAVAAGDQDLKDWWEFSPEYQRYNEHVEAMAQLLGVSDEQVDDLWRLGATL